MKITATAVTKDGTPLTFVIVDDSVMNVEIERMLEMKLEEQVEMGAVNDLEMWNAGGRRIEIS